MAEQPGLEREKNDAISLKHGNPEVGMLRITYGTNFAPGFDANMTLSDVLHRLDEPSLSKLIEALPANR